MNVYYFHSALFQFAFLFLEILFCIFVDRKAIKWFWCAMAIGVIFGVYDLVIAFK